MTAAVLHIGLILVGGLATWKGSDYLAVGAAGVSDRYGLPPLVEGSLIVAIGSSFPELATTVLSVLLHGEFDLGIAAVVGSAVFNILVIPGLAGVLGGPRSTTCGSSTVTRSST